MTIMMVILLLIALLPVEAFTRAALAEHTNRLSDSDWERQHI